MAMKMTKSERLELRGTREQRRIIGQAVELCGGSLTDIIISAAQEKAVRWQSDGYHYQRRTGEGGATNKGIPAVATWPAG